MAHREAGAFAERRYLERRRAWLRRIWWVLPPLAVFEIAIPVVIGLVFVPTHMSFGWGVGIGMAAAMVLCVANSPPQHIDRWRQGAEGEKATARRLRALTKSGWELINDIDSGYGNIDHVLVGPNGVYVLESKNLNGVCSVHAGVLAVHWREDPTDGYENRAIAPKARASAAQVSAVLKADGLRRHWVQSVVVLWATFEQRSVISERVAWVRGKDLAEVLAGRDKRLSPAEVEHIARLLRSPHAFGRLRSPTIRARTISQ